MTTTDEALKALSMYSNIFYLLPVLVLFLDKHWVLGAALIGTPIASFVHHTCTSKVWSKIDKIFAVFYLLVSIFLFLATVRLNPRSSTLYIGAAIAIAALIFFFKDAPDETIHSVDHILWHILGGTATLLVVIAYCMARKRHKPDVWLDVD